MQYNSIEVIEITSGEFSVKIPRSHTNHPRTIIFLIGFGILSSTLLIGNILGVVYSTILFVVALEILERENVRRGHYMLLIQILNQELEYIGSKSKITLEK